MMNFVLYGFSPAQTGKITSRKISNLENSIYHNIKSNKAALEDLLPIVKKIKTYLTPSNVNSDIVVRICI